MHRRTEFILGVAIPVLFCAAYFLVLEVFRGEMADRILHESGPFENIQFLTIGTSFLMNISILKKIKSSYPKWAIIWFGISAFCCFYVAGEEISWGQHVFGWETPSEWTDINDHNETNLHNTSQIFDQFPKVILEAGIYAGGIIIPTLQKFRPSLLPAKFRIVYPSHFLTMTACALLFMRITKPIDDAFDIFHYQRLSEIKENIMYYFIFLYMVLIRKKLLTNS